MEQAPSTPVPDEQDRAFAVIVATVERLDGLGPRGRARTGRRGARLRVPLVVARRGGACPTSRCTI